MGIILTADQGLFAPITKIFGYFMNWIYTLLSNMGVESIGWSIILFTFLSKIILFPLTLSQQKSTKMMAVIQPEIQAIQKKYQGKNDQASMLAMQTETRTVYDKYGVSMGGSCIQLLIQLPIILALYRVIMNIPAYVPVIKEKFTNIVDAIGGVNAIPKLQEFATSNKLDSIVKQVKNFGLDDPSKYDLEAQKNYIIDFLYKLNETNWSAFLEKFSSVKEVISQNLEQITNYNSFFTLNLATAPSAYGLKPNVYWLIPILAGLSQFAASKVMQSQSNKNQTNDENPTAQTMQSMTTMMPLISVVISFSLSAGIGIYWIASSVVTLIQQLFFNMYFKKIDMDEYIKKCIEKANKKRAKKGLPPLSEKKVLDTYEAEQSKAQVADEALEEKIKRQQKATEDSTAYYANVDNPNSLFAKAGMVARYNEKKEGKK